VVRAKFRVFYPFFPFARPPPPLIQGLWTDRFKPSLCVFMSKLAFFSPHPHGSLPQIQKPRLLAFRWPSKLFPHWGTPPLAPPHAFQRVVFFPLFFSSQLFRTGPNEAKAIIRVSESFVAFPFRVPEGKKNLPEFPFPLFLMSGKVGVFFFWAPKKPRRQGCGCLCHWALFERICVLGRGPPNPISFFRVLFFLV